MGKVGKGGCETTGGWMEALIGKAGWVGRWGGGGGQVEAVDWRVGGERAVRAIEQFSRLLTIRRGVVMRHKFIRFVTSVVDEDSGRRQGVFQATADLMAANDLAPHQLEELQSIRGWFSQHLDAPDRFSISRKPHAAKVAISWYKSTAHEHIRRMHAMCRILGEHGIQTEMITTVRPGYVVFEDETQIAAIPFAETTK